jgi:hypothetical protein
LDGFGREFIGSLEAENAFGAFPTAVLYAFTMYAVFILFFFGLPILETNILFFSPDCSENPFLYEDFSRLIRIIFQKKIERKAGQVLILLRRPALISQRFSFGQHKLNPLQRLSLRAKRQKCLAFNIQKILFAHECRL